MISDIKLTETAVSKGTAVFNIAKTESQLLPQLRFFIYDIFRRSIS